MKAAERRGKVLLSDEEGKPGAAESAYARLAAESYEFINRSMAMRRALRRAYDRLEKGPGVAGTAEETCPAWRTSFEQVYDNLFAIFLRPVRLFASPAGLLARPLELPAPSTFADLYAGWLRLIGEAQTRYLRAASNAWRSLSPDVSGNDGDLTGQARQPSAANLWRNMVDEGVLAYVETLDRTMSYVAENQFILPKPLFAALHKVMSGYPEVQRAAREYETLFHDTWERALRLLSAEVCGQPGRTGFDDFFKTYISVFNAEFDRLLRSPEFVRAQNSFVNAVSDLTAALRQVMQAQLDLFPFLPFASKQDTDAIAQRLHSYKARSDALERKVRQLEARLQELAAMANVAGPSHSRGMEHPPAPAISSRPHNRKAVVRSRSRAAGKLVAA